MAWTRKDQQLIEIILESPSFKMISLRVSSYLWPAFPSKKNLADLFLPKQSCSSVTSQATKIFPLRQQNTLIPKLSRFLSSSSLSHFSSSYHHKISLCNPSQKYLTSPKPFPLATPKTYAPLDVFLPKLLSKYLLPVTNNLLSITENTLPYEYSLHLFLSHCFFQTTTWFSNSLSKDDMWFPSDTWQNNLHENEPQMGVYIGTLSNISGFVKHKIYKINK